VTLIPDDEGEEIVLFEGTERIDLLQFQDSDFVLAVNSKVPAGEYEKIRLEFSGVSVVPSAH